MRHTRLPHELLSHSLSSAPEPERTSASDMYALGVVLSEIATGQRLARAEQVELQPHELVELMWWYEGNCCGRDRQLSAVVP